LHGPDDNPLSTQDIASVRAGDIQGSERPGKSERQSKHKNRQNPVRCQFRGQTGSHCYFQLSTLRSIIILVVHSCCILPPRHRYCFPKHPPAYTSITVCCLPAIHDCLGLATVIPKETEFVPPQSLLLNRRCVVPPHGEQARPTSVGSFLQIHHRTRLGVEWLPHHAHA
jgi:hypothetical protein